MLESELKDDDKGNRERPKQKTNKQQTKSVRHGLIRIVYYDHCNKEMGLWNILKENKEPSPSLRNRGKNFGTYLIYKTHKRPMKHHYKTGEGGVSFVAHQSPAPTDSVVI